MKEAKFIDPKSDEGKLEEKRQTAINLKKSGIDLQTIVDCTGLSMEEVEKL